MIARSLQIAAVKYKVNNNKILPPLPTGILANCENLSKTIPNHDLDILQTRHVNLLHVLLVLNSILQFFRVWACGVMDRELASKLGDTASDPTWAKKWLSRGPFNTSSEMHHSFGSMHFHSTLVMY